MCKEFYVRVAGLGDDGRKRLIDAGIRSADIMVVDKEHRNRPIIDAIFKASGIGWDQIVSSDRRRRHSIARMIYVRYALINGDTTKRLSEEMNRDRTSIDYYLTEYENLIKFNKTFKAIVTSVDAFLIADPLWCPPIIQKSNTSEKKAKKRRRSNEANISPEEIARILDHRQLKINFDNNE